MELIASHNFDTCSGFKPRNGYTIISGNKVVPELP
jgi:hypothetical protein